MERFTIARNHMKFYSKFGVSATYTVPRLLLASNDIQRLFHAVLKEVLNHHPMMGVTIDDEGSLEPKWVRLSSIDLRQVLNFVDVDPREGNDRWTQAALRAPFDVVEDLPLWRLVVATEKKERDGDVAS